MRAACQFFSFFGSVVLLGPESPSPVSGQPVSGEPASGQHVKAAVVYWHVVRSERAVFDVERTPRMGFFRANFKRNCIRSFAEKSPAFLSDVRSICARAEASAICLRQALGNSELPPVGVGFGAFVDDALSLRCAVSAPLEFFGASRATEIAALSVSDVTADVRAGLVELQIRAQKNDQLGAGQMAHVVALPERKAARPVRLLAGWLWFRGWLSRYRDREGRMSSTPGSSLLVVGLARARFGLRMASLGVTAARKLGLAGRNLSPRKGGARLSVMNGMAREATRDLGGWKSQAVTAGVFTKGRSGEVVPEMRSAISRARKVLEVTAFVETLYRDVGNLGGDTLGLRESAASRIWFHRFCLLRDDLVPAVVVLVRDNFLALMCRRARLLGLSGAQKREVLQGARDFRSALKVYRS